MGSHFLQRVVLKNYKSIAACDVRLGSLTFLVGPNGSGKSNFLDAVRLVADALQTRLDQALRERGGIDEVRRRSTGHPHNFGVRVDFVLPDGSHGHYAFEIAARSGGNFEIKRERFSVGALLFGHHHFEVSSGKVIGCSVDRAPRAMPDRLYLANLSGVEGFREAYDALAQMGFYNLNPNAIREFQAPDPGKNLVRDGGNLASVLGRLETEEPEIKSRVEDYLAEIVPGVRGVERIAVANKETLQFRQDVKGAARPWRFYANSMSDGTLRALGVLVAVFQGGTARRTLFVGLEEPEAALHPAAAGVLLGALRDASRRTQIVATSHSPDLLDSVEDHELLAVSADEGITTIGPMDEASRSAVRDALYTPGELLRLRQIEPDESACRLDPLQLDLFTLEAAR